MPSRKRSSDTLRGCCLRDGTLNGHIDGISSTAGSLTGWGAGVPSGREPAMKVLVISDVHANLTALEAVLKASGGVDATWCLGDLVGYGPDPNEVIGLIRAIPNLTCLLGNHDAAVIGGIPLEAFNGDARRSLEVHELEVNSESLDYLRSLPQTPQRRGDVTLTHGSPRDPLWEYVINKLSAEINFDHFVTPWCFVGHSHFPSTFSLDRVTGNVTMDAIQPDEVLILGPKQILNPGSVGQPRDRDPRAAFAIFDSEAHTWQSRRVEYDVSEVQRRIREAGLPERHAMRLAEGW